MLKIDLYSIVSAEMDTELVTNKNRTEFFIDEETWNTIKALELNADFEKAVLDVRKKFHIPLNGFTEDEYNHFFRPWKLPKTKYGQHEPEKFSNIFPLPVEFQVDTLKIYEKLSTNLIDPDQTEEIILKNSITGIIPKIAFHLDKVPDEDADKTLLPVLNLSIFAPVTRNQLDRFIKLNWPRIEAEMEKLSDRPMYYISERDRRIIELRDIDHLPYSKIVDIITKEFRVDNLDGQLNEDSIKNAYSRAKAKISSLIH